MRCRTAALLLAGLGPLTAQQWSALDGPRYLDRGAAYDTHRRRLVAFSGDGETWEFDGNLMLRRPLLVGTTAPPARIRPQMAYDAVRRHVLMFGGIGPAGTLADTWTFDGASWTQRTVGTAPPRRTDAAITFDGARGRVLMFGGQSLLPGQHQDTWEHDGIQWLQRTPAHVPSPNGPVMAFDSGRGVVVMVTHPGFLGQTVSTWEWNGVDWQVVAPSGAAPQVSGNESLAYDPLRQRTVMTGGAYFGDLVWEWDGASWTSSGPVQEPLRLNLASWFDADLGQVVVAGGIDVRVVGTSTMAGSIRLDAFGWNGSTLTRLRNDARPPSGYGHAWLADLFRAEFVRFGGVRQQATTASTWKWNGASWSELQPVLAPSPRADAVATFDWVRGEPLLFGGATSGQYLADLWAWTGTDWQLRSASGGPPPRASAGFGFDLVRGVAVVFGGISGSLFTPGSLRNDTWEWNGTTWSQRTPTSPPGPREGAAMAFDVARGRMVLFGGRIGTGASDQLGDTWEWDGQQWTPMQPLTAPPALLQPSMGYEFQTGLCVLAGTQLSGNPVQASYQLWGWNGAMWAPITSSTVASGICLSDQQRGRFLAAGDNGLWSWSRSPATVAAYGSPCGNTPLQLLAREAARLGAAPMGLEMLGNPGQLVAFAVAETPANVALGNGCSLLVGAPAATVFRVADAQGRTVVTLPILYWPTLHGYQLFAQAGVLDAASPGGFQVSAGLRFVVGD